MEKISLFIREFGALIIAGVVGIGILIYGLWGVLAPEKVKVEIVKSNIGNSDTVISEMQIVVDIAGAVEKPGVYKLPSGSRIGDALVMAGGLSAKADREWVAKTMNLAEVVEDGEKVYIPAIQIISDSVSQKVSVSESQKSGKVNINTASESELDSLEGVGEVRSKLILDNRPYSKVSDLVEKAKIPESVYEKIKDKISVY